METPQQIRILYPRVMCMNALATPLTQRLRAGINRRYKLAVKHSGPNILADLSFRVMYAENYLIRRAQR